MNVSIKDQSKACRKGQVRTLNAKRELIREVRSRIESRGYDIVDVVKELLGTPSGTMTRLDG